METERRGGTVWPGKHVITARVSLRNQGSRGQIQSIDYQGKGRGASQVE